MSDDEKEEPTETQDESDGDTEEKGGVLSKIKIPGQGEKEKKPQKVLAGDYIVQVHVIEARDLKGRGLGDMSDPMCTVEVMGKKQSTKIHKKCLNCVFDQVLSFEFHKLEPVELQRAKVKIGVYDANTVLRNVQIGSYEFDVAHVYFSDDHEVHRAWLALSDYSDKHEGIQGYLRVSVVVLGPDDEQKIWPEDEDDEEGDSMLCVLMPPQIDQIGRLLKVKVHEVRDLIQMDDGALNRVKCDPYPLVEFAGIKVKTKHAKGTDTRIDRQLNIPVMEPIMGTTIMFSIYDWDATSGDDRVATVTFDYENVKAGDHLRPYWVNFYGAPRGEQKGVGGKMNKGYITGSTFRGRALVSLEVEEEEEPKKGKAELAPLEYGDMPPEVKYVLQMDLYEGSEIVKLKLFPDMHVELQCGKSTFKSRRVEVKNGRCEWYETVGSDGGNMSLLFPEDTKQCPDVFIYLCNKGTRLCFTRHTFKDMIDAGWGVGPTWITLQEDKALDKLKEDVFPGSLLYSLRGGLQRECPAQVPQAARPFIGAGGVAAETPQDFPESEAGDDGTEDSNLLRPQSSATEITAATPTIGALSLTLIEGENLPAADKGGTSDPYCRVKVDDCHGNTNKHKTKTVKKTLKPKWRDTVDFRDIKVDEIVHIKILDHDKLGSDDTLGVLKFRIRTLSDQPPGVDFDIQQTMLVNDDFPDAKLSIRVKFHFTATSMSVPSQPKKGKSFKNVFSDLGSALNISDKKERRVSRSHANYFGEPPRKQFQLRAYVYQCRGITAADRSGLSDPFIVIRCMGKQMKTKIKKETLNAEWYECLMTSVELPYPFTMAPDIQVSVYDYDKVSSNDLLGRLHIHVQDARDQNPEPDEVRPPKWLQLVDADGNQTDGEVLISFHIMDAEESHRQKPKLAPPTVQKWLQIATLGVRDLNSVLGVHKPFMEFKMASGKGYRTNPSSTPTPQDSNFLQLLKIPVDIPIDRLYAPVMSVEVKDSLLGGLIKRRIGAAAINLNQFMIREEKYADEEKIPYEDMTDDQKEAMQEREEREAHRKEMQEKKMKADGEALALVQQLKDQEADKRRRADEEAEREREAMEKKMADLPQGDPSALKDGEKDPIRDESSANLLDEDGRSDNPNSPDMKPQSGDGIEMDEIEKKDGGDDVRIDVDEDEEKEDGEEEDENTPLLNDKEEEFDVDQEKLEDQYLDIPPYMVGRARYDDEMEDVIEVAPFHSTELFTGQKNAGIGGSKWRKVGNFKGIIEITDNKDDPLSVDTTELLQTQNLFLRVYVLKAHRLTPTDSDGTCDPYLLMTLGKQKISTRDDRFRNTLEPEFYESYEIPCTIPGDAKLHMKIMDWDGLGDDLVGETTVDVEDRWFCPEWRDIAKKPVERRSLHSPSSSFPQGKLEMWIELLTANQAKTHPMINIKPPPPSPYELRVIVWGCRNVTIKDTITEMNDLYLTGALDVEGLKPQRTDTHLRSKKGLGNFNWRLKFPLELPQKRPPRFRLQIWDMDVFSANDSICEAYLSLKGLFKRAHRTKDRVIMRNKGEKRMWIDNLRHPNYEGNQGKVEVSFEVMPAEMAEQLPAGMGRSDPNMNPVLPPPEGRMIWTMNPFKMLRQILGDKIYWKLCLCFWCILLICFLVFFGPSLVSTLTAGAIL